MGEDYHRASDDVKNKTMKTLNLEINLGGIGIQQGPWKDSTQTGYFFADSSARRNGSFRLDEEKKTTPSLPSDLLRWICSSIPSGVFWLWEVPIPIPGQTRQSFHLLVKILINSFSFPSLTPT